LNKRNRRLTAIVVLLLSLVLGACSAGAQKPGEPATLKLAVLPILETAPLHVAEQEGLFAKHNVKVELVPVASAPERDQIINAGQADGMINEVVSTLFYNKTETRVKIVRYARAATSDQALFSIMASGSSSIHTIEDLKGVEIGVSQGTVIEYLTDRLLQAEGFSDDEIFKVAVPKIPDRIALLGSGELEAGMLPEPPTSLAAQGGARLILDDSRNPQYSFSVLSFRVESIEENPETLRGFLAAYEEAVELINKDPNKWLPLLAEQNLIPPPLMETFQIPTYVTAGVPSEAQWQDALNWALEKGLVESQISYKDSVTSEFLP
jgi:NitT/TauT family transport system substrate-binding protein